MSARSREPVTAPGRDRGPARCACGRPVGRDGLCSACRARVRRRAEAGAHAPPGNLPASVHEVLGQPGVPLSAAQRARFEPRLGADLGAVRLHTDAAAARSARDVRAHAYALGNHVVFGAGRYRDDAGGRRLLAHELAHTVQQRGLQRRALEGALPDPAAEARLERDAEAAASWVERAAPAPPRLRAAAAPLLLRQAEGPPPAVDPAPAALRDWEELDATSPLRAHGITAVQRGPGITAFRVDAFVLPSTKGPVLPLWEARASAQALEATIEFGPGSAPPRTGLWQSRDRTGELRSSWLGKLGWTTADAAANWQAAGGDPTPAGGQWVPRVRARTCQMDHVVELQFGGTNTRENIQVLDADANTASGRDIWQYVSRLAQEARSSLPAPRPDFVLLHFQRVSQPEPPAASACPDAGARAASCMQVEQCALTRRVEPAAGQDAAGTALETYPITAAGASDTLRVPPAINEADLSGAENRAPRQIVPGVLLNTLLRRPGPADAVAAGFDTTNIIGNRSPTRVPLTVIGQPPALQFTVDRSSGDLRLQRPQRPGIDFMFPYLSPVHLDLSYDPARGWSGRGRLRPTLPLLRGIELQVELLDGRLRAFTSASPARLRSPLPGLRFTQAEIGAQLLPDFEPSGVLAFEIGPRNRAVVSGRIELSADASGVVLAGPFTVSLPNVDPVEGRVTYRNGELSGRVEISSDRIRIPGVQRGSVRGEFDNSGLTVSGEVELLVAGTPVTLEVRRLGESWIFTGTSTLTVPGGALAPVRLRVSTDGRRVWGEGSTAVRVRGLTGPVNVRYQDGRWSGGATLPFSFGRAAGSVTATLNPNGRVTGRGTITYPITERLTATVGIILNEDRTVGVDGELVLATVRLFDRFPRTGGRRVLFRLAPPGIPIWGVPLGPLGTVGLTAQVRVGIGVDYGVGPGEVRNVRARAAVDLFAESPNFEFHGGGQIYVPWNAGFFLNVDGAIALDAAVASVSSGLGVTVDAGLRGQAQIDGRVDYAQGVLSLRSEMSIRGRPEIGLGVDAFVRATALSADLYEKRWRLAGVRWGSDLEFGVAFPFQYASNQAFVAPSFDQIRWIYPQDVDAAGMLRRLIG